tara:strand:- start:201 stop:908 length:708 start_codon:yes stop_codon:yes gene_type:complete
MLVTLTLTTTWVTKMSVYFSYLPNFDYVNRIPGEQNISSYIEVKNLFKRVKISNDIFQDLTNFEKYIIQGDDRPDVVAQKVYGEPTFDWVVLLSNNIINIQNEWPMSNQTFEKYMNKKYGAIDYNNIHHYETKEIKDSSNTYVIQKKGIEVPSDFTLTYFDPSLNGERTITDTNRGITNLEYELKIQDEKRNIFILRDTLIAAITEQIKELLAYEPGSTQYVDTNLVRGDNINLY